MPLTISTKCPSCGGDLDFEEGTNAVHCGYCGSNHVVTGHGRVLSYYIPEKIPIDRAVAVALMGLKNAGEEGWRAREATLFFVPFYRFFGQTIRWEVQEVAVGGAGGAWVVSTSIERFGHDELSEIMAAEAAVSSTRPTEKRFELNTGYIDRSLPALDAPEMKVSSLGLRPEVMKLSLFEHKAVSARGMLAPVKFSVSEKEEYGFTPIEWEETVARSVFGKMRSVIYFPFWLVEVSNETNGERVLSVVDGVSGEVPNPKAPVTLLDRLIDKGSGDFDAVGFRPLKCPDCASDLPVRPKDVVFFCGTCRKAWYITGSEFKEIPYTIVAPKSGKPGDKEYFPFWVVRTRMAAGGRAIDNKYDLMKLAPGLTWPRDEDKAVPLRFFVPAFRIGNLRVLSRLSANFTRLQPVFQKADTQDFNARGCFFSPDDAILVAPLILFSLVPKGNRNALKFALEAHVEPIEAELALVPFYKGKFEYLDGLFGWSMPAAALKD